VIVIYTDGSAIGNPGPAGWAVLVENTGEIESGYLPNATNNQAELFAVLKAVELCPADEEVTIVTDSKMAVGWLSRSWRIRQPHILTICSAYFATIRAKNLQVKFELVRGHRGLPGNELVDKEARRQAMLMRNQ